VRGCRRPSRPRTCRSTSWPRFSALCPGCGAQSAAKRIDRALARTVQVGSGFGEGVGAALYRPRQLGPASPRLLGVCCQCGVVAACLSGRRRMLSGCRSTRDAAEPPTGSPRLGVVTATRLSSRVRTCPTPILRLPGRCAGAARWCGSAPGTRGRSGPPGGCGPAAGAPRAAPAGTSGSLEFVRPLPALQAVTVPRGPVAVTGWSPGWLSRERGDGQRTDCSVVQ